MKLGSIVQIDFLDHAEYDGTDLGPVPCSVFGVLIAENKESYEVCSWMAGGEHLNHNNKCFSILKAVISKVRKLK